MIEIPFSPTMIAEAKKKAEELGEINNSITKGGGNRAGYLGEFSIAKHIKANNVSCELGRSKYNRDLIKYKGSTEIDLEVKTKRRTANPKSYYDASIADTSKHQQPNYYLFLSITFQRSTKEHPRQYYNPLSVWFCGFMERDEYFKKAKLWKKGDVDNSNDFTTKVDMYNLPYSELIHPKEFFNIFK
tara:strand:- start:2996 stop:3556 length:561 start_codon:yes stop_codon:yes gene_type:complete